MSSIEILVWILASYGMTLTVTEANITSPLREWAKKIHPKLGELVRCPMCFSFWTGLGLSYFWTSITGNIILDGFISVASVSMLFCMAWFLAFKDETF